MRDLGTPARIYLAATGILSLLALAAAWIAGPLPPPVPLLVAILFVAASAPFRIQLPVFGSVSIAFTFVFASLLMLGIPAAALAGGVAGLGASYFRRPRARPPLYRSLFNAGELVLSSALAGVVFDLAGGTPGDLEPAREWWPLLLATIAFFLANTWLVAAAVSLTEGLPLLANWRDHFLWTGPAYLSGTFLAATLVLGIQRFGPGALFLSLPLLYVLYFSLRIYMDKVRQERKHGTEMAGLYLKVIEALALAIDAKDRTTQRHIRRVQTFAVEIGRTMGLSHPELEALKAGALLHDIGKLAVPEHVLCKPGRLSRDEFDKMKIHPRIGAEILETVDFPFPLTEVVRSHHEKWDGTGYPDRLKGEEIPLTARILAVVDCFDALTSDRPYRRPLPKEEALAYIRSESGTSYDPRVVEALVRNLARLEVLAADVNRMPETATAPDKRAAARGPERLARDHNALRESILDHISSAHRELYALYEIAQGIAKSLDLDETMGFISGKIARLLHYRCLVLYLYDRERRLLKARFVTGHDAARLLGHEIPAGERMSGWAAVHALPLLGTAHRDAVRREGMRSDLEGLLEAGAIEPLENAIVTPLLDGDAVLGVLALYDRSDQPYEDDHLRVISTIGKHVSAAVKNSLTYAAGKGTSLTDPLTRLPNARYLFVSFEEELARAMRQQVPLSIVELDINNFKEVNDQFGHSAGDRILRTLARVVRGQLRGCDTCVRYAADEFVVIVPGVGRQEIGRMQARIKQAIEAHRFPVHGGRAVTLSASLGSASFPEDGRSFDALLAVADARMYEAKSERGGRQPESEGYQKFSGRRDVPVN
jgi:diguanylate cyclase (GGDEF)-like protein/putative nucleotidyltransferase with HDIG domain